MGAAPFGFKGADFDFGPAPMKVTHHPLQRFYGHGDLHFLSPSVATDGVPTPARSARDIASCGFLDEVRRRHAFVLILYVVMPEHVHLLLGEPPSGDPSKVLQVVKQKVSRLLRGRSKVPKRAVAPSV